jgi:purine-binding chemotaxis protein CheW
VKPRQRSLHAGIDWRQVHERLARLAVADGTQQLSAEQARVVLEERARALARVAAAPASAAEMLEVATFTLGNERYGIETRHVREVARLAEYTPVPGAPDFVLGILNLRGEIVALIDLRRLFGIGQSGTTDTSRVVVLGGSRREFGVLVDAVSEVLHLRADEVFDPPPTAGSPARNCLRGVTREALIILDGGALLQDGRLIIDASDSV